jgi:adenosylmethionine-8-amino-7-oxononanoate aminotransferase
MKDYELFKPLVVESASGSTIQLRGGKTLIDAISSWWCKSLGHGHPRLKQALYNQIEKFEHVILANTTNETIVKLSEQLATLTPTLNKVLYASDGSCAVEAAMKMSLHSRAINGEPQRDKFISLSNGYHGETAAAMSISDLGIYKAPYHNLLFDCHFIENIPYVTGIDDPLWQDCSSIWPTIEAALSEYCDNATALIVEPIVQGAGNMRIYSADLLRRLRQWSRTHTIHLIADEIMTGIGRTGKMLACEHAGIVADFVCLSKGLTGGWLPLSAVLTSDAIYQCFYDDYERGKTFLHSHTHSGNALAASVAVEVLTLFDEQPLCQQASELGKVMLQAMQQIADSTGRLQNVRGIGAMVAAELICDQPTRRLGYEVYQQAVKLGALLRPLGNTLYWLPPLTTTTTTIDALKQITQQAIECVS